MRRDGEIGHRVAEARHSLGLTQAALAQRVGIPRSTLAEIETGKRGISASELYRFSDELLRPLGYFFGPPRPQPSLALRAKSADIDEDTAKGLVRFDEYLTRLRELLGYTGVSLRTLGPTYQIERWRSSLAAARYIAASERQRMGLGVAPVSHLRELLEERMGLPSFGLYVPQGRFCGAFVAADDLVCLAVNVAFGAGRKNYTLAHEFAHYLTGRHRDHVSFRTDRRDDDEERYAESFAEYFLLPLGGLENAIEDFGIDPHSLSVDQAILLASHFGSSYEALLVALRRYGIVDEQAKSQLLRAGRPHLRAKEMGLAGDRQEFELLPATYQRLAFTAYEQGKISRSRLADFLGLGVSEARAKYDEWLAGIATRTSAATEGAACGS